MRSDDALPALLAMFPALVGRLPWLPLGRFPTALERVEGILSGPRSRGVELWVKREDACGGPYGGNKVRKLEFLLAEARARGARGVATIGAYGSNHVLATSVYGRRAGLEVAAVVFPQPLHPRVLEHLLIEQHVGARIVPVDSYLGAVAHAARLRMDRGLHWIPAGGASPAGVLGYVSAALELGAQVRTGEAPRFDAIYVPLGSGSTAAGLWLGLGLAGLAPRIVAVRTVDRMVSNRTLVRWWSAGALRRLERLGLAVTPRSLPTLEIDHRFFGAGYARPTPAAEEAVALAASAGLALETTYTGKTLAALLADARAGRLEGKKVLFLDTFNSLPLAPLLPAERDLERLPPRLRRRWTEAGLESLAPAQRR